MILLFWIITLGLVGAALCFVLPWVHRVWLKIVLVILIPCLAYTVYYSLGASQYLQYYYSTEVQAMRENHVKLRVLLGALRKKEFNFHVRLEENPNDQEAQWNLLNIMGIEAYERHQYAQAIAYWQEALLLIPETPEQLNIRTMIERLLSNAKTKDQG